MPSTKKTYKNLDPIWVKAALLGSMWGSIEIIVGSFLHNLRIPLAGTILSAIGMSLLVGGQYLWRDKGLIWRAGIICALMKSISPSAVIIGPMIGILSEAIVLDLFVRVSRGAPVGVIIGSGVAVCLPFVQTIVSLLLTYGLNIATLYVEIYKFTVKSIGLHNLNAYQALGVFFSLDAIFGFSAALLGMAIGRKAATTTLDSFPAAVEESVFSLRPVSTSQRFSIMMLIASAVLIPLMLLAISNFSLPWASLLVCAYTGIMVVRYPNSWKRFSKVRIWIGMIVITILAGLLLGEIANKQAGWSWDGIFIGLQMSLRAVFMVVAFNVVSIELRNPTIINWVLRRGLGQLATALEVAFDALPTLIAALGEQRNVLRHPVASLSRLFLVAQHRMMQFELTKSSGKKIFIVTGDRGTSKTTLLTKLVEGLRTQNVPIGGILSPVVLTDSARNGYDVVNIRTGERTALCRSDLNGFGIKIGEWIFKDDGIRSGITALNTSSLLGCAVVIVDEVGPLELEGKVWASSLDQLIESTTPAIILVVRENLIERVRARWSFIPEKVWKLFGGNSVELQKEITEAIIDLIHQSQ